MVKKEDLLLYAITDRRWLDGRTMADDVDKVLASGATFLQLREKHLTGEALKELALSVQEVAKKHHVPFVINDNVALAKEIGADGVHVGQSDMEYSEARRILGPDAIIGVSAGDLKEAVTAEKAGADYIGVGSIFSTSTKADATRVTMDVLKEICATVKIPVVAIGGIDAGNAEELIGTGICGICAITALFGVADPAEGARIMREKAEKIVKG